MCTLLLPIAVNKYINININEISKWSHFA